MLNKTRVITAIWMALLLIPFFFLGGYFVYALAAFFAYVATYELVKMHNEKYERPSILTYIIPTLSTCLVLITMIADLIVKVDGIKFIFFALFVIIVLLLVLPLFYGELKMTDGFFYIGSILYAGASFAVIAALRNVEVGATVNLVLGPFDINLGGLALFGYVILTTIGTDIGAYEVGCRLGKHKLIPSVSPNKSIEGSIGGSLIGAIVGTTELILVQYFFNFSLLNIENMFLNILVTFILTLVLTVISQIGDLIASKLKREYGIKDYGKIFPGHGGVMDRFDSLILTSSVFFIILILFGVVLC